MRKNAKARLRGVVNNDVYYKQRYFLTIIIDAPSIISECNNNYFHSVDKMAKVREIVNDVCSRFNGVLSIIDHSATIILQDDNSYRLNVCVEVYMKLSMKRKEMFDLMNMICRNVEGYENNLANWLAKRKKQPLPYKNPNTETSFFEYQRKPYEGKEGPEPQQLSLNLEEKQYCPNIKFFLIENKQ